MGRGEKKANSSSGGLPSSALTTSAASSGSMAGASARKLDSASCQTCSYSGGMIPALSTNDRIWPSFITAPFMPPMRSA